MSQYPPGPPMPPPGQPPYPPQGPQYGQPYGQQPYGAPGGYPPQPAGTSGAAIGSLICGILGCIPVITSLLAIILGFVGIKATGNGRAGGRGLAIAGLILGILGIIGWLSFGGFMVFGFSQAKKLASNNCKPFVQAVAAGDYSKASAYSTMSDDQMQALHDQIAGWGTLSEMSVNKFNLQKNAGTPGHMNMSGEATFSTAGQKAFDVELESESGTFKVVKMEFP